jgi:hypothetical protein
VRRFVCGRPRAAADEEGFGEELDRDFTSEARVSCTLDFAHAAVANRGENFVRPNLEPGGEQHVSEVWHYNGDSINPAEAFRFLGSDLRHMSSTALSIHVESTSASGT